MTDLTRFKWVHANENDRSQYPSCDKCGRHIYPKWDGTPYRHKCVSQGDTMNEEPKVEETVPVAEPRYTPKAHDVFEAENGGEAQNLRDAYRL